MCKPKAQNELVMRKISEISEKRQREKKDKNQICVKFFLCVCLQNVRVL